MKFRSRPPFDAVTDALNLEALAEALADAFDHVGDQRARETVRGTVRLAVALALDHELAVFEFDVDDLRKDVLLQLAFRTFNVHGAVGDFDVDAAGNRDGKFTNA